MKVTDEMQTEVLARFGTKRAADLTSVLPTVAAAPVGGYVGRMIGRRYNAPELGSLIGTVGGGVFGRVVGDQLQQPQRPELPPMGTLQLDPTSEDIPPWAVAAAAAIRPHLKQASHTHNPYDVVFGEIPGYSAVQGAREGGLLGAAKGLGGTVAGGVGAGLAGHLLGSGIERLIGHGVNVPLINMSLPELLGGVAGTIGATKGFRAALG